MLESLRPLILLAVASQALSAAKPHEHRDLYRAMCDTANRPVAWLAQGTTGTHSAYVLKCALGDPAFHWNLSCNTDHKPTAYLVQRLLHKCYLSPSAQSCTDLDPVTWAKMMEEALQEDGGAGVSLFDVPFNMARPYVSMRLGTMVRDAGSWARSRMAHHDHTLICKDMRHGLQLIECAKSCRNPTVADCFTDATQSSLVAAYQQENFALKNVPSVKPSLPKVDLTIATVVNNEATYIREWIAYHALRGVQRVQN